MNCILAPTASILLTAVLTSAATAAADTVAGFDGGSSDGFTGNAFFEAVGGNPDGNAHHILPDMFGISLRTGALGEPANPGFLGDYSSFSQVTLSFDVRTDVLRDFIGNPISRDIGIALRDRDLQGPNGASGVFVSLGLLNESLQEDWTTLSVTIEDPTSPVLPAGWIGFGDEDPDTFEPILPAGATFASVLAGVDELEITTFVPGFFFGPADTDVRIDNVTIIVEEAPENCPADISGPDGIADGNVDALDFLELIAQWGSPCAGACTADITGPGETPDGNVDALDYLLLIAQWGSPGNCPAP